MNSTPANYIAFGIDLPPADPSQLKDLSSFLNTKHITYLIGVATLVVLAILTTLKAMSFGFEEDKVLLNISLYVGVFLGLISGATIKGSHTIRIQMMIVGMIVCSAAGLCCSMFMILCIGSIPSWISSICILASAIASIWLLTIYHEIVKAISTIECVNSNQLEFIMKAANHFDVLMAYAKKIHAKGRKPVMGEYWVIQDWVFENSESSI